MLTVITGASSNHYKTLIQFIESFKKYNNNHRLIIYNLGLKEDEYNNLKNIYEDYIFEIFDYSKYPSYVNIKLNSGEYAWKPIIIHDVCAI